VLDLNNDFPGYGNPVHSILDEVVWEHHLLNILVSIYDYWLRCGALVRAGWVIDEPVSDAITMVTVVARLRPTLQVEEKLDDALPLVRVRWIHSIGSSGLNFNLKMT
jgi:hypothetical protein